MAKAYIAGDWGSSHLRLSLVDAINGTVLAQTCGPGVTSVTKDGFAEVLASLTLDWLKFYPSLPVILCGMAGADIGWVDAGYAQCPLSPQLLHSRLIHLPAEHGAVAIIPGIKCLNLIGATDLMRGEETQILGALAARPELCQGQHLLCLPGTHSKWVWLENGAVQHFITGIGGELYTLLRQHSMLVKDCAQTVIGKGPAFADGVARSRAHPSVDLLQLLFETRSRQLSGLLVPADASSFMSGLIIGRDIVSATTLFQNVWHEQRGILFIGNAKLTTAYLAAAKQSGLAGEVVDGDVMSLAGIHSVYLGSQAGGQHHAN